MPDTRIDAVIYQLDAVIESTSGQALNDFRSRIGHLLRPVKIIVHASIWTLIVDDHGKHVLYPLLRAGYEGDGPRTAANMIAMCRFATYNEALTAIRSAKRMCHFPRHP